MPGQVRVGGTWKTFPGLYVKVSGSWRNASSAWVKVGGVWKQWFIGKITDTFTRTTTTNLGTSDTGVSWTTLFGSWLANGSVADSTSSVSSSNAGAVAYVPLGAANATVSATVTPGTGPAFWITAAGSWWGAISYSDTSTYSYSCNCVGYCSDCVSYSCSDCVSTSTYDATASSSTTYSYYGSASTYSSTIDTRYCTSADVAAPYYVSTCYQVGVCDSTATGGVCSRSCPSGGVQDGSVCYLCSGGTVNGPNPTTGSGSVASCYIGNTNTTYSCPSGGSLSGSTCTVTTSTSGGIYPSCSCGVSAYVYSGGSYPNCSCGSGTSCSTCTGTTTNYYARIIYSTSTGSAYTVYSTTTATAEVKSIKVVTSGTGATVTGYSDTALTTSAVSATVTGAATTGTNHGIVKSYSANAQGTTADNFSVGL
jgi:conjugal transfer mating pair stabilization protein TraN